MNETLKAAGHIGAELGAARAENEKLRGLLDGVRKLSKSQRMDNLVWSMHEGRIKAALSLQAEPVEPAPAQDELEAVDIAGYRWKTPIPGVMGSGYGWSYASHWSTGPKDAETLMTVTQHERIAASLTRPAQTEQQPVRMVRTKGSHMWEQIDAESFEFCQQDSDYECRELYAAPIAQTAPQQNVDAGLLDRIDAAIKAFTSGKASMHVPPEPTDVDVVLGECWNLVKRLGATPSPAQRGDA